MTKPRYTNIRVYTESVVRMLKKKKKYNMPIIRQIDEASKRTDV